MPTRNALESIITECSAPPSHLSDQLSYGDMLHFADVCEGWAQDERLELEMTAKCLGWADGMRRLADLVGPDWNPPDPPKLSLVGFLARKFRET